MALTLAECRCSSATGKVGYRMSSTVTLGESMASTALVGRRAANSTASSQREKKTASTAGWPSHASCCCRTSRPKLVRMLKASHAQGLLLHRTKLDSRCAAVLHSRAAPLCTACTAVYCPPTCNVPRVLLVPSQPQERGVRLRRLVNDGGVLLVPALGR